MKTRQEPTLSGFAGALVLVGLVVFSVGVGVFALASAAGIMP